jgi:hypothetical protein
VSLLFAVLALAQAPSAPEPPHAPTALGFRPLLAGPGLAGWHPFGKPGAPATGWELVDGVLHLPKGAGAGDLVSDARFGDFELVFEWKVAAGANSGVKYRFRDERAVGRVLGPEYQVLDDAAHPDAARAETSAGALYALAEPAAEKPLRPAGEWNEGRVIARGGRFEHWLNGKRLLALEVGSTQWNERKAASKFATVEDFALATPSPIALQDHGDEVWYRNVFVRELAPLGPESRALFDGATTAGWTLVGQGSMHVENGELVGIGGEGKGFLVHELRPADFVLELELKNDTPSNSGVQVRSRLEGQAVLGYQIEVDPSERAWSGGLYLEVEKWLANLEHDPIARTAFRPGQWNHYRIECAGPLIRSWVNGILTCDYRTARPEAGVIALQLHDPGTKMRWRNVRLFELSSLR